MSSACVHEKKKQNNTQNKYQTRSDDELSKASEYLFLYTDLITNTW